MFFLEAVKRPLLCPVKGRVSKRLSSHITALHQNPHAQSAVTYAKADSTHRRGQWRHRWDIPVWFCESCDYYIQVKVPQCLYLVHFVQMVRKAWHAVQYENVPEP